MTRSLVRIGNATMTAGMAARLADRPERDVRLRLLAIRAAGAPGALVAAGAPREWLDRLVRAPGGYAPIVLALAEAERAEAAERRAVAPERFAAELSRLARRACHAAAEAQALRPPPAPPRLRVEYLFPERP
jgi:hypothetical protein